MVASLLHICCSEHHNVGEEGCCAEDTAQSRAQTGLLPLQNPLVASHEDSNVGCSPPSSVSTMLTENRDAALKDMALSPALSSTAQPLAFSSANTLPWPSCLHRVDQISMRLATLEHPLLLSGMQARQRCFANAGHRCMFNRLRPACRE